MVLLGKRVVSQGIVAIASNIGAGAGASNAGVVAMGRHYSRVKHL